MILAKFSKKIAIVVSIIIILVMLVCSCSSFGGLKEVSGKTEMTIGDFKFTDTEYNYFYQNYITNESYSEEEATLSAQNDLRHYAAVLTLCKKYGIELTKEDRDKCDEELSAAIEFYGDKKSFEDAISSYSMTSDLYLRLIQLQTLEANLRSYMVDEFSMDENKQPIIDSRDEVVLEHIKSDFFAIKQIFICNDSGDDVEQNRALIESAYSQLLDGADFDDLMDRYNETDNTDSITGYFTDGMLIEEVEKVAKATPVNQYSEIVETSAGFSIIYRLPINDDYVDSHFNDLRFYYQNRCFNEILQKEADSLLSK